VIRPRTLAVVAAWLCLGCGGYFNALYNARRRFGDAERAAARGEIDRARTAWAESAQKASASYRGHPDGRWADDALYLAGRAYFRLGEVDSARTALVHVLARTNDPAIRSGAHAYLGALQASLGDAEALVHLDSAIAFLPDGADLAPLAFLWRGRVRLDADLGDGWSDLAAAAGGKGRIATEARFETVTRALAARDSTQTHRAILALLGDAGAADRADSVIVLIGEAGSRWGAAFANGMLTGGAAEAWPARVRGELNLARAKNAFESGDTTSAIALARQLADREAGVVAARARRLAADWRLLTAARVEDLADVRAVLFPVAAEAEAGRILRAISAIDVLVERAERDGELATLFAAAEIARDELGSKRLAGALFVAYADLDPSSVWAPKALLAASALSPTTPRADSLRRRFSDARDNVYVQAVLGVADQEAYATAEDRLARTLLAAREDATNEAGRRASGVTRMAATLDSIALAARADSVRVACSVRIDTLAITGIRADSVRGACMRGDSARIAALLVVDTVRLRAAADSARARRPAGIDTFTVRLR
jgi:hypothetical protein